VKIGWTSGVVPLLGSMGLEQAVRHIAVPEQAPWSRVLLVLDPEAERLPLPALQLACRLVGRGGELHVLAPVVLPLAVPLEAPPGDETERAAACLQEAERWAGARGVTVVGRLRRGRAGRGLLRETVRELAADAVVLPGDAAALRDVASDIAPAQPILIPG
jgi:hypothetical protein